jgi:VWFA-related protein
VQTPAGTGFTLRTTSRLVDVAVVAFDKKGHPVTNLKPGDLEIYDNGRKQQVSFFTQAGAGTEMSAPLAPSPSAGAPADAEVSNRNPSPSAGAPGAGNTTIFLIDASNVAFADLTYARGEMLRFLKTIPADERVGLYVLRKHGFQILKEPTTDHSAAASTLSKWMPSAQDLAQAHEEEERDRQQMEYVRSKYDLTAMNGNTPTGEGEMNSAPDPQRRSLGDDPQRDVLIYLVWVARHLAAFTGHKSLIWVASDNVLADFSDKAPSIEKGARISARWLSERGKL